MCLHVYSLYSQYVRWGGNAYDMYPTSGLAPDLLPAPGAHFLGVPPVASGGTPGVPQGTPGGRAPPG